MPIIPILNLKGGVAKTVTTVALAECFASHGHRVLLVDADHQCMAGELALGEKRQLHCESQKRNFYDLLVRMLDDDFEPASFGKFVAEKGSNIGGGIETLDVLPCSIRIDDIQTNVAKAKQGFKTNDEFQRLWGRRRDQMKLWLNKNYDFVLIDCPPSLAPQVKFVLTISDHFIVPTVPDRLSVRGSKYLMSRLSTLGFKVKGLGTIWSLYREQNNMHRAVVAAAGRGDSYFEKLPKPFKTIIPNATKIAEATEPEMPQQPSTFTAKYTAPFAKLFESLCDEIVKRSQWEPSETAAKSAAVAGKPTRA
jgi:chromosome partitioning protein